MYERDDVIRTITETVKLLNRIADNRLVAQFVYPELHPLAESAREQARELILAVGDHQAPLAGRVIAA
jgi:hypothetical protein